MKRTPPPPPARLVPIRGPSGRLYGMLDPTTLVMEFQRGGQVERIDLSQYRNGHVDKHKTGVLE